MKRENKKRIKLVALVLISLLALGLVFYLSKVFIPLGIALLVAYIFEPIFKWLDRHHARRSVTVTGVYILLTIGLFTAFFKLGPVLRRQANDLVEFVERKGVEYDITWESISENMQGANSDKVAPKKSLSWWERILGKGDTEAELTEKKETRTQGESKQNERGVEKEKQAEKNGLKQFALSHLQALREDLPSWLFQAGALILSGAGFVANYLTQTVLVLFYAFFFMLHFPKIEQAATAWVPRLHEEQICCVLNEIDGAVSGFFRGRFGLCFIAGAVTTLGLLLSGISYWLLLGIAAGFLNIIPFIGFIIVFVPSLVIALTSEHALFSTIGVMLTFAVVEGVVEPFVGSFVIAQGVRLHPVTVVAAILAGGALFGVLGVFIAVPLTAIIKILSEHYLIPVLRELLGPCQSCAPEQ